MSDQMTISEGEPDLKIALEALLFAASNPVSISQLAEVLSRNPEEIALALKTLEVEYKQKRGVRLQWHIGKVQMTSAPEFGSLVEKFLGLESTSRLSWAALETLAIVAFKQPITRPGIDAIRGVNSDGVLRNLLSKGLLEETGRAETPGRPILYGTTSDFLQHFGLSSIQEIPPLEDEPANNENDNKNDRVLKD
jgi:segregation and condensation protein B